MNNIRINIILINLLSFIYYMIQIILFILCLIYFFILILITIKNKQNNNKNDFDVVIVGAGISGIFCGRRLNQFYPDKKILIIEKNPKIGGRLDSHLLHSKTETKEKYAEFGAMRFFPKIHKYTEN